MRLQIDVGLIETCRSLTISAGFSFPLFHALSEGKLKSYLFSSPAPQYLTEQIRKYDARKEKFCPIKIITHGFYVPFEGMYYILPLLYQCGYMTIKDYNPICQAYTLDIPNREVLDKFPVD